LVCETFANQIANQPPDISVSGNTIQLRWRRNAKQKRTLSYRAAQSNMRIIELENRCTVTVPWVRIHPLRHLENIPLILLSF
jgi:hypothetical protein